MLGPRAAGSPGRRPAVGRLLGTSWPFPGEGTHPTSEGQQLTDMRVPRGQGTPGGRGPGWPLAAPRRAGCRTPGTRLQPRPRKRCTQEPDSPPPGESVAPTGLPTYYLSPPHSFGTLAGTLPRQPDASAWLPLTLVPRLRSPCSGAPRPPALRTCSEPPGEEMRPGAVQGPGGHGGVTRMLSAYDFLDTSCRGYRVHATLGWGN